MKKSFIAVIAAVILLPSLYAAISPSLYTAEVQWHNYKEARAMKTDKPIFVFAKMRFCMSCAAMEKEVLTNPALAKVLNEDFIPVKETINFMLSSFVFDDLYNDDGEQLTFRGFPAVMIITGDNYDLIHGYQSIEQLHKILDHALKLQ